MRNLEKFVKTTINALEHLSITVNQQSSFTTTQTVFQAYDNGTNYEAVPAMTFYDEAPLASMVYPNPADSNTLVYPAYNDMGDRLVDFSAAGYHEGWTPLPSASQVPVVLALDPDPGSQDDAPRIQQALDRIADMPLQGHFRGALQLNRGSFRLGGPLEIRQSGIVLQGDPVGGTLLEAAVTMDINTPYLIKISGEPNVMSKRRVPIVDTAVPVGERQVTVRDVGAFREGDTVLVAVAFNEAWIKAVGMDVIHPKGNTAKNNGWKPGRFEHLRRIIHIDSSTKRLTLNEPLTTRLEQQYGGGFVEKYESRRVTHVGLQYFDCVFPANRDRGPDEIMKSQKSNVKDYRFADEMFNHLMLLMEHAENCWVRQVRSVWWRNFARLGTNTLAITLQRCHHTFPQPVVDPRKPLPLVGQFAFEISGQMILIEHCHVEYSFHAYSYKGRIPGPNVVYQSDCVAKNGDVGPHMKWSSGQLYDNCNIEGQLIIQDRFDAGSGHGWSGANSVVWNTVAHAGMVVQKPPLAQNFLIGSSSKRGKARVPEHDWAWEEHPDRKVNPPSLYMAQLHERRRKAAMYSV